MKKHATIYHILALVIAGSLLGCSGKPPAESAAISATPAADPKVAAVVTETAAIQRDESSASPTTREIAETKTNQVIQPPPFSIPETLPEETKILMTRLQGMQQFLQTNKIEGMSMDTIILNCGLPTRQTDDELVYRFDTGLGGHEWIFKIENGIVRRVEYASLD